MGHLSELLVKEASEPTNHPITQTITIAFHCPVQRDGKTQHILITAQREIEMGVMEILPRE